MFVVPFLLVALYDLGNWRKKNRRRLFAGGLGFFGSLACLGQTAVVKKDLFAAKSD
ncbi:MAG: hypothetical protein IKR62_04745 [Victivallales bacterium]|nr:hypothetical protein [Victivallales bacterium]